LFALIWQLLRQTRVNTYESLKRDLGGRELKQQCRNEKKMPLPLSLLPMLCVSRKKRKEKGDNY
jgi:hypothetical protein